MSPSLRRTIFLAVCASYIASARGPCARCTLDDYVKEADCALYAWLQEGGRDMPESWVCGVINTLAVLRIRSLSNYLAGAPSVYC